MANYYTSSIEGEKMTQSIALEVLGIVEKKSQVRSFFFIEGALSFETRGLDYGKELDLFLEDYEDEFDIKLVSRP